VSGTGCPAISCYSASVKGPHAKRRSPQPHFPVLVASGNFDLWWIRDPSRPTIRAVELTDGGPRRFRSFAPCERLVHKRPIQRTHRLVAEGPFGSAAA